MPGRPAVEVRAASLFVLRHMNGNLHPARGLNEILRVEGLVHAQRDTPDTLIQINNRMMLITTPRAREPLAQFLTPLPQMQEGGMQSPSPEAIV